MCRQYQLTDSSDAECVVWRDVTWCDVHWCGVVWRGVTWYVLCIPRASLVHRCSVQRGSSVVHTIWTGQLGLAIGVQSISAPDLGRAWVEPEGEPGTRVTSGDKQ